MKNIPEICKNFPFSLTINDYGKIITDDNCFEDISRDKIKYVKEAIFSYDKINIEQNSKISNSDNIGISILGDINPFFCDFIFKAKIDSVDQESKSSLNIIVKSQISSLSIKRKDIIFDDSFLNKIKKIGLDESYNDKEKALQLNKIFQNYGHFVPLKIYLGGYFYQDVEEIKYQKNKEFLMDLKSKVNIKYDNIALNTTSDISTSYKSFFDDLFSHESINIIGGDTSKNTLEEWKNSLNDQNSQIVGYENVISITELLNDVLEYDISKKLSEPFKLINDKYELRKKYYDYLKIAKDYKEDNQIKQKNNYINGICEQSELIYSEKFKHTEKKKNFEKIFDDIIVGLKIIDNWKDNTNGEFTLQDPILKKNILRQNIKRY